MASSLCINYHFLMIKLILIHKNCLKGIANFSNLYYNNEVVTKFVNKEINPFIYFENWC